MSLDDRDSASGVRPAHLLIVDDNETMRELLREWFALAGYHVSLAEDGEAAWDLLRTESVDIMITDHDMPRLTGLDLLRRVRSGPLALPVFLISGHMPRNEPDLRSLLPPGSALEKPFALAELQAEVAALLSFPRPCSDGRSSIPFTSSRPQSPPRHRAAG